MDVKELTNLRGVKVIYPHNKKITANDIRELLDKTKLTETALANILNIRTTTLEHYLEGRTIPKTTQTFISLLKEHPYLIVDMRVVDITNASIDDKIARLKEENQLYMFVEIRCGQLRHANSTMIGELEDEKALKRAKGE